MARIPLLLALVAPTICYAEAPSPTPASRPVRDPAWAQPIGLEGVPNLHRVSPTLYRSAQPTKAGMAHLKDLGIKTVINLRSFHSDEDELVGTGLKALNIPVKAWHAEKEDAIRFLKIVTDPANQPVLVHCQDGADRTGTMCALYRMAVQGWTKDQALRELSEGGYGFHEIWVNLKQWLDHVDIVQIRREAALDTPATQP